MKLFCTVFFYSAHSNPFKKCGFLKRKKKLVVLGSIIVALKLFDSCQEIMSV